jgi:hypothetical protein
MSKFGKMMLRAGLAAAALGMAGSASAGTFLITYKGTVFNSRVDAGDIFGGSGTSLNGKAFTAVYTLTDPKAGGEVFNNGTRAIASGFGVGNPVTGALTINGATRTFGVGTTFRYVGYAEQRNNFAGVVDSVGHSASVNEPILDSRNVVIGTRSAGLRLDITSYVNNIVNSTDYTAPLNYSVQSNDFVFGNFSFAERYLAGNESRELGEGSLNIASVTIAPFVAPPTGGVPEPASWALMLGGFALTGGALRGSRRRGFVKPGLAQ